MSRISAICVIACLAACATNNGGDDDPGEMMQQSVVPQAGSWHYVEVTPVSSTCTAGDDPSGGNFAIASPSLSGFTVLEGGSDPFDCSLDGGAFDCPNRAWYSEDLRPSIDAVLTAHATAEGTFSSTRRGSGTQDATVTCTGSACSLRGTWPCQFTVRFQIEAN